MKLRTIFLVVVLVFNSLGLTHLTTRVQAAGVTPQVAVQATTIRYVASGGSDAGAPVNDCKTSSNPCATIQHAVDQSNTGDEIRLAGGTYTETISIGIPTSMALTLRGGYSTTNWTVSNKTIHPTLLNHACAYDDWDNDETIRANSWLAGDKVTIQDLDLTGCGISSGGEMLVERVSITNGRIRSGGGMGRPVTLSDVTITGGSILHAAGANSLATLMNINVSNSPEYGIYNASASDMVMTDLEVSGCHDAGIKLANGGTFSSITRALIQNNGLGIENKSSSIVTLDTVRILNNTGRGVLDKSHGMVMRHVTIQGNHAINDIPNWDFGNGGGYYANSHNSALTDVTIQGNTAEGKGGGIYNRTGGMSISESAIIGNTSTGDGGGIYNGNEPETEGAPSNPIYTLAVTNSTFSGNVASNGGGIYNVCIGSVCGPLMVTNSTFSGNSATVGGGINSVSGEITIRNTIIADSTSGGDCFNAGSAVLTGGYNIIETTSTCNSVAAFIGDPNLGNLTGSPAYFPLNIGSPAIDAGDNATCSATDLLGWPRPYDGDGDGIAICDIGPVEFVPNLNHLYLPMIRR